MSERPTHAADARDRAERIIDRMREMHADGQAPAAIFNDPGIYALEQERIFARSWIYLAHESEVPEEGDYVLRYVMDDPYVVVRSEDGEIRALHNVCRHRGMQICRSELGNAAHFRCPYHGWTYRNDGKLVGVPVQKEAYGDRLDKESLGLLEVPRLDSYNGMVFGCLDPDAMSLDDWLGDIRWYLDLFTTRSPEGLEVVGSPQRWRVDVDWKICGENFAGDSYHTLMTHRSMVELGQAPSNPKYAMYGEQIHVPGRGHSAMMIGAPPGVDLPPFWGYPQDFVDAAADSMPSKEQYEVALETRIGLSHLFPNFSIHNPIRRPDHTYEGAVPMMTWRTWNPVGPGQVEISSWFMVERGLSDEFRRDSRWSYLRSFGISGTFEQDDAEIWSHIARNAGTWSGSRHAINYQMGWDVETDEDWPGPGVAQPINFTDANLRNLYGRWLEMMTDTGTVATGIGDAGDQS